MPLNTTSWASTGLAPRAYTTRRELGAPWKWLPKRLPASTMAWSALTTGFSAGRAVVFRVWLTLPTLPLRDCTTKSPPITGRPA